MSLPAGVRLGPYEILSPLGAGGMGEVYRAKDTRLERIVAIKVLPAHMADDAERRVRFEREARTISSLDHPHICTLYDVGRERVPTAAGDELIDFLVMQYLEGETLADRLGRVTQPASDPGRPSSASRTASTLSRGPIPLDQALRHAAQIADALDAAHRKGIVHRDLKPGNVMLTKSGVKLLDFGLAKLRDEGSLPVGGFTIAATRAAAPLTAEGSLLGTLQYMSPEQLEGREIDARSDLFACGTILFEMLTGRRAFESPSQAGVIAAILGADPAPLAELAELKTALPAGALRGLDRALRKCLAKNPDERWQCAADLADELKWIDEERLRGAAEPHEPSATAAVVTTARSGRPARARWWMAATAALMLVSGSLSALLFLRESAPAEPVRFVLLPPDKQPFAGAPGLLGISPDGRRLVFATETDRRTLWIRPLDSLTAQQLPGTDGGWHPFWSPDSQAVGFVDTAGRLKKINVSGGPPLTLAEGTFERGAWSREGVILFAGRGGQLHRIPDSGGQPTPVTELDKDRQETAHNWPVFLPDGRRFIYHALSTDPTKSALYLASIDSPGRTHMIDVRSSVEYFPGYLLYHRDGTLMAQPFDEKAGRLAGDAVPVVENVSHNPGNGRAAVTVSTTGVLAYRTGSRADSPTLTWFDRSGKALGKVGDLGLYRYARLSPDGHQLAVGRLDEAFRSDLWIIDLDRGVPTRFTFDAADDAYPVWSPDGAWIVFRSTRSGAGDLYRRASGGAGGDELLYASPRGKIPTAFSADGKTLLFFEFMGQGKGADILALPLTEGEKKPYAVVATTFNEGYAVFSPDGRWIAYDSNDSGADQVYVQPFPPTGTKVRLSTTSGDSPQWSADGKTILYSTMDNRVMAVDVSVAGGRFRAGAPRELFLQVRSGGARNFTVDGAGQRFLMPVSAQEQAAAPITVVLNWDAGLKK